MPIGIHPIIKPFTSHKFYLEENDVIYLFSDGYRDQIGEKENKKFKLNQFNEMLVTIHDKAMDQQLLLLEEKHNEWKGNNEQTDDILIMGIKI
jgi:serine phosphatase RsbU (regulator of sigma subunit)